MEKCRITMKYLLCKTIIFVLLGMICIGGGLGYLLSEDINNWKWSLIGGIIGFGIGLLLTATLFIFLLKHLLYFDLAHIEEKHTKN